MRRGEIWWINFDPAIGSEIKKTRPAVIVSNNISNKYSNRCQVIPATSAVHKLYPPECFVKIEGRKSKVMADQIMTVSEKRLVQLIGSVTAHEISEIDRIIKLQLGL